MIANEPIELREQLAAARRFAALSGPFQPADAIAVASGTDETDAMVAIGADLASSCATQSGPDAAWVMRDSARQRLLQDLADRGALHAAVEQRRAQRPLDQATEDLLDALLGAGSWADDAVVARLGASPTREELQRLVVAIERAGSAAPAYGRLNEVRATLARMDLDRRGELLLDRGFFGRVEELARIADWVARPSASSPVQGMFVTGAPGIGKSTLLDEAVRRAVAEDPTRTLVRVDFDRAGLDARDWIGLTSELGRQVAIQVPAAAEAVGAALLQAASDELGVVRSKGEISREQVPPALAWAIQQALAAERRTLLVVLDTVEVLRSRGSTHPERVFAWLDQVARLVAPLVVLVAGRGNAFDDAPRRIVDPIRLAALEPAAVDRMLARLEVPAAAFATVIELAEGNPLAIRLAAKVIRDAGPSALEGIEPAKGMAAGLLYRILLARVEDDDLRTLANPGLVVRRINADVIRQVLAPQLGLGDIEPARAQALFETLASEHWLVEEDPQTGFVRHRPDIRAMMLPILYSTDGKACARIDRAAAAWFARRPEPWCAIEAAYHRLQGMRRSRVVPKLDPEILRQLDTDAIGELPEAAQDIVHRSRGERTTKFRGEAVGGAPLDPYAANELRIVMEKGDVREAAYLYERIFANAMFGARSEAADAARAFLWRAGRWTEARRLDDERRRQGGDDGDEVASPLDALVRLEMWAEWRFGSLVARLGHDASVFSRAMSLRQRAVAADLSMGALGFALRRTGPLTAPPSSTQQDLVGAAFATWAAQASDSYEQRDGLALSRRRVSGVLSEPVDLDPSSNAVVARLLAVDLPYASTVAALLALRDANPAPASASAYQKLAQYLAGAGERVAAIGGLGVSGARWQVIPEPDAPPTRALERLTALGLLAEWLGAAAFQLRDPDLRLLARSAERWRRTTAGRWSFERPPRGWTGGQPILVDVTVADRVAALDADHDPAAAALGQLGAWSASGDPERLLAALQRRYKRTLPGLAGRQPIDVAAVLLKAGAPSAFVPPVAVLASRGRLAQGGRDGR